MKVIPARYVCDICGRKFDSEADALECEAAGLPETNKARFPIGMILGDKGGFYEDIAFAIADYDENIGHDARYVMWACRSTNGDSLGKSVCGSSGGDRLLDLVGRKCSHDPESDNFKRMVAWLESQGIPVTVWDGSKPVPLAQYLSSVNAT